MWPWAGHLTSEPLVLYPRSRITATPSQGSREDGTNVWKIEGELPSPQQVLRKRGLVHPEPAQSKIERKKVGANIVSPLLKPPTHTAAQASPAIVSIT